MNNLKLFRDDDDDIKDLEDCNAWKKANPIVDPNYFKDKIDWKFLNYLVDKSTKLEDDGVAFQFIVDLNCPNYRYSLYSKIGDAERITKINQNHIYRYLMSGEPKLMYYAKISSSANDVGTANQYAAMVKNKCKVCTVIGNFVMVAPNKI